MASLCTCLCLQIWVLFWCIWLLVIFVELFLNIFLQWSREHFPGGLCAFDNTCVLSQSWCVGQWIKVAFTIMQDLTIQRRSTFVTSSVVLLSWLQSVILKQYLVCGAINNFKSSKISFLLLHWNILCDTTTFPPEVSLYESSFV